MTMKPTLILRLCYFAQVLSVVFLTTSEPSYAAEYSCTSGDVSCLIASINDANATPGEHVIALEPGSYTLQVVNNAANGLPVITGLITIQGSDDVPTVIVRDPNAPIFRIFQVAVGGELHLDSITVQRGGGSFGFIGPAILNRGITSLQNSAVIDSRGESGAINNFGTLHVVMSIIANNFTGHQGGGIGNAAEGNAIVENSTIRDNGSADGGGIRNEGSLIVNNSAILFNSTDIAQSGGGILNVGGSVDVFNSTIAKNTAGGAFPPGGGAGITNFRGHVSITNSTIQENQATSTVGVRSGVGGGILNEDGTLRLKNTIVAGNSSAAPPHPLFPPAPDCFGTITSLGNNLIGDPSGCAINLQPSDLTGDPGLGGLLEMGDDSPGKAFYPVLPGSVVINAANPAACSATDQLGNPRVGTCDIGAIEFQDRTQVAIDIRPRRDANKVNPHSTRNINVAILSDNGFDATTVDLSSVRFGATGIEAAAIDVGRRDVNGDGQRDLVLRFQIQDLGIECGATSITLTGQISDGQSIIGSGPITTTGCK